MANVEKSLEKFKRSLVNGTYYEAQQLIKTVYHRLRSRKFLEESRDLLEKASCLQLEHAQVRIIALARLSQRFGMVKGKVQQWAETQWHLSPTQYNAN